MHAKQLLILLLGAAFASAGPAHAQTPVQKSTATLSTPDLSKLNVTNMLQQMQQLQLSTSETDQPPPPLQLVAQFLQLSPAQIQEFVQLLQARQSLAVPLLQQIQQASVQLKALLNAGGNPSVIGALVLQIHALQQQVAHVQQDFLSKFVSLLDPDQQQRFEAVRIAAQLQPILPAFQALNLL